ncbi:hypothetical protein ABR335_02255 [Heyndrickxia faecalis]|uniref:Uncharacterized protein n=1 Tax=Heyndrickxia faecalis TaxID=2824910 RepID=A0AAU7WK75_9BACI
MNMDKLSQVTPGVYKIEENYVGEAMKNLRENQLIIQGDIFWHSHETKKVKLMKRASYLVGYNPFMKMDYDYLIELKSLLEILLEDKDPDLVHCTIKNARWITKDYIYTITDNKINIEVNLA